MVKAEIPFQAIKTKIFQVFFEENIQFDIDFNLDKAYWYFELNEFDLNYIRLKYPEYFK